MSKSRWQSEHARGGKGFGSCKTIKQLSKIRQTLGLTSWPAALIGSSLSLNLQWVREDSTKAENSFLQINNSHDDYSKGGANHESKMPNAIAAAIIRRGTDINTGRRSASMSRDGLRKSRRRFTPFYFYRRSPIQSKPSTCLRRWSLFIYGPGDGLRFCEFVRGSGKRKIKQDRERSNIWNNACVMKLILSNDRSSIGLHPAVYFYSWTKQAAANPVPHDG